MFVDAEPPSSPSSRNPSDSEGVDIVPISSLSKRKATLSPRGSRHPQKFARTDTPHRSGTTVTGTKTISPTEDVFESHASTASGSMKKRKRKKVLLTRNRELMHSLIKSGSGTFIILSPGGCRRMIVSGDSRRNNGQSQSHSSNPSSEGLSVSTPPRHRVGAENEHFFLKLLKCGLDIIAR